jgi:hypothetical protein
LAAVAGMNFFRATTLGFIAFAMGFLGATLSFGFILVFFAAIGIAFWKIIANQGLKLCIPCALCGFSRSFQGG